MREPLALTAIMLLYSNLLGWWAARRGVSSADGPFRFSNPLLLILLILGVSAARRQPPSVTLRQIGLSEGSHGKSIAAGALLGTLLSLPPLFFFARPIVLDTPVEYGPVSRLRRRELLRLLFLDLAVGVGLCEETFFRGLLHDSWARATSENAGIAASAATFAGWHFAVTLGTLPETNVLEGARLPRLLRPHTRLIALTGGMLATGVAGVIFGVLRRRTGSLWGPVVAHWLVDSIMIASLWRRGQLARLEPDGD